MVQITNQPNTQHPTKTTPTAMTTIIAKEIPYLQRVMATTIIFPTITTVVRLATETVAQAKNR
jgi:hypothetical protein